jgi:hypothetical protein
MRGLLNKFCNLRNWNVEMNCVKFMATFEKCPTIREYKQPTVVSRSCSIFGIKLQEGQYKGARVVANFSTLIFRHNYFCTLIEVRIFKENFYLWTFQVRFFDFFSTFICQRNLRKLTLFALSHSEILVNLRIFDTSVLLTNIMALGVLLFLLPLGGKITTITEQVVI